MQERGSDTKGVMLLLAIPFAVMVIIGGSLYLALGHSGNSSPPQTPDYQAAATQASPAGNDEASVNQADISPSLETNSATSPAPAQDAYKMDETPSPSPEQPAVVSSKSIDEDSLEESTTISPTPTKDRSTRVVKRKPAIVAAVQPQIVTLNAIDISAASATLRGRLDSLGALSSVEVYFQWCVTTDYQKQTASIVLTAPGEFAVSVGGLTPSTDWHFRARVSSQQEIAGADATFTTLPIYIATTSDPVPPPCPITPAAPDASSHASEAADTDDKYPWENLPLDERIIKVQEAIEDNDEGWKLAADEGLSTMYFANADAQLSGLLNRLEAEQNTEQSEGEAEYQQEDAAEVGAIEADPETDDIDVVDPLQPPVSPPAASDSESESENQETEPETPVTAEDESTDSE